MTTCSLSLLTRARRMEMIAAKRRKLSLTPQRPLLATHQTRHSTAKEEDSRRGWGFLPREILIDIFGYLSIKERRSVLRVCHLWNAAMNDRSLWRNSCVCLRSVNVSAVFWSLLRNRGITQLSLSCNNSNISSVSKLQDYVPDLIFLEITIAESVDMADKAILSHISSLQCLKRLALSSGSRVRIHEANSLDVLLSALPGLKQLRLSKLVNVDLSSIYHDNLATIILDQLGTVSSLEVTTMVGQLPCLSHLELKGCSFSNRCFEIDLRGMKSDELVSPVVKLSLEWSRFEQLSLAPRLQYIESLNLSNCQQGEEQLKEIVSKLHHLKELNLSGNSCTDAVLKSLHCPLEAIDLKGCHKVTSKGIRYLAGISDGELKHLGLAHCCGVEPSLLTHLYRIFYSLQSLDLSGWVTLDAATLKHLQKLSSLTKLVIPPLKLSAKVIQNFRAHFQNKCTVIVPS